MKVFDVEGCGHIQQPAEVGTLCQDKIAWQMILERDQQIEELKREKVQKAIEHRNLVEAHTDLVEMMEGVDFDEVERLGQAVEELKRENEKLREAFK